MSKSVLLEELLGQSLSDDGIAKLRLAKQLALAVLRFHHAPWLPEHWNSNSICFHGKTSETAKPQVFEPPCLNAKLLQTTPGTCQTSKTYSASTLATNETLFNLGIIYLELGYDAPFEKLIGSSSPAIDAQSQVAEFLAARPLGETIHRRLNMTYGRLVKKCLNCNFGVLTELDNAELQGAIIMQVVKELDRCLDQIKAFNALAP